MVRQHVGEQIEMLVFIVSDVDSDVTMLGRCEELETHVTDSQGQRTVD